VLHIYIYRYDISSLRVNDLTMSLQNEEAVITYGRIILSGNIRGMVRDEGCCIGLSYTDLYRVYVGCGA